MLDTSHLFEMYRDEVITANIAIQKSRTNYPQTVLYSDIHLKNKSVFSKLRKHMVGMELEPDPSNEVTNKTIIHINLAYNVYHGIKFRDQRIEAINRFNHFLKEVTRKLLPGPAKTIPTVKLVPEPQLLNQTTINNEIEVLKSSFAKIQIQINTQESITRKTT